MTQERALNRAIEELINSIVSKIRNMDVNEFLRIGVDPFRFSINVGFYGERKSIKKEVEHKLAMNLENYVGNFHEKYLGNCEHVPTQTMWQEVNRGQIPGIDIMNRKLKKYYQVKSKHNSMNSSSSAKLAQELHDLTEKDGDAEVGCAWIVAKKDKKCIGEKVISNTGYVLKGKDAYSYITGDSDELDEVIDALPERINDKIKNTNIDVESIIEDAAEKIYKELRQRANSEGLSIVQYLKNESID